jgi:hypothetical protein
MVILDGTVGCVGCGAGVLGVLWVLMSCGMWVVWVVWDVGCVGCVVVWVVWVVWLCLRCVVVWLCLRCGGCMWLFQGHVRMNAPYCMGGAGDATVSVTRHMVFCSLTFHCFATPPQHTC